MSARRDAGATRRRAGRAGAGDVSDERSAQAGGGAPYRGGAPGPVRAAPEDAGLVGELIRQFADPYAFYRELVQNSIDAGSTHIHVQLVWEPGSDAEAATTGDASSDRGTIRVSVRDDGSGMSREVLEEQLTVLFRSSKESREDAIGKFGIGFVSVLAVAPDVVIVDTSTGDGTRWSLHLHGDQSYDLFRAEAPRGLEGRGTTVSLHVPIGAAERADFFARSEAALRRWCRHARVPIRFVALVPGHGDPARDVRVDEPLSLDAIVSVQARSRDGLTTVIAGVPRPGERYGAFFNQGLLLHETRDHDLGELAFKVMDPRLEHTLSRDDVRRDDHYARAMTLVASTIRGPLAEALAAQTANAAEAYARGGGSEAGARLRALIDAHVRAGLPYLRHALKLPVVRGGEGLHVASLAELDALVSHAGRDPLADALARSGRVLADLSFAPAPSDREAIAAWIEAANDERPRAASERYTLVVPLRSTAADDALLARVSDLLASVARRPSALVLADVHGLARPHLAFPASDRRDPWLVEHDALEADPFRFLARPPLVLRADHPIVERARGRAADAPALAATLLARAILVARGALTPSRDTELTERALGALVGGGTRR